MTLPVNGKKLTENEAESIENAVKEAGISAIHPERMEALGAHLVERLKGSTKGHADISQGWRTCNRLQD